MGVHIRSPHPLAAFRTHAVEANLGPALSVRHSDRLRFILAFAPAGSVVAANPVGPTTLEPNLSPQNPGCDARMLTTTLSVFRDDSDGHFRATHSAVDIVPLREVTTPVHTYTTDECAPPESTPKYQAFTALD